MEHSKSSDEENLKRPFTIFGEPIVKTRCQRNALITGISGGVMSSLVAFLFTSNSQRSTSIGFGSFIAITFVFTCYCTYDEYIARKNARIIKKAMYEINMMKQNEKLSVTDGELKNA